MPAKSTTATRTPAKPTTAKPTATRKEATVTAAAETKTRTRKPLGDLSVAITKDSIKEVETPIRQTRSSYSTKHADTLNTLSELLTTSWEKRNEKNQGKSYAVPVATESDAEIVVALVRRAAASLDLGCRTLTSKSDKGFTVTFAAWQKKAYKPRAK